MKYSSELSEDCGIIYSSNMINGGNMRMRFQEKIRKTAAAFFAVLMLVLPAGGVPGFAAEARQTAQTTASEQQRTASFSTVSLSREGSVRAGGALQSDPAYEAIRQIRSSEETAPYRRVALAKSLAADSASSYSYVSQTYGYQSLTSAAERTLYDYIADGAYQVSDESINGYYPVGEITVGATLDQSQVQEAFMAFTNDHPEVFWLSNVFQFGHADGATIVQLYSVLPANECNADIETLETKLNTILQSIPSGLNAFDREEALYDYLIQNCSYNYAAVKDTGIWQAFSAYGALTDGSVVCEGYSRGMELLSSYLGLPCALIRGSSGGVGHMWNAVNLAGSWYYLDLTWCDGSQPIYNYFNITDSVLRQTHTVAPAASKLTAQQLVAANSQVNLFLPSCTATAENYYVVKGIKINSLSSPADGTVVSELATEMTKGDTTIAFYIDAGNQFTTVVNQLVSASPYKMKSYLQQASQASGKSLKQASYVVDSANHGLEICITY